MVDGSYRLLKGYPCKAYMKHHKSTYHIWGGVAEDSNAGESRDLTWKSVIEEAGEA